MPGPASEGSQRNAVLSPDELSNLVAGMAPKILVAYDMDGVCNVSLDELDPDAEAFLKKHGSCFADATMPGGYFTLMHRPLFEWMGPVFKKLGLLPVFGSQRIFMFDPSVIQYYETAKNLASHCHKIPGFEYFAKSYIEAARQEAWRILKEQAYNEIGGMPAFFEVAQHFNENVSTYDSVACQYVQARLQCLAALKQSARSSPVDVKIVESLRQAKQELFQESSVTVDPRPFDSYKERPCFLPGAPHFQTFEEELLPYDTWVRECIDAPLCSASSKQKATLHQLDELCDRLLDFGSRVMGGIDDQQSICSFFFGTKDQKQEQEQEQKQELGFLFSARGLYSKWIKHYNSADTTGKSTRYFQALWNLYVEHVRDGNLIPSHQRDHHDASLPGKINELTENYKDLNDAQKKKIQADTRLVSHQDSAVSTSPLSQLYNWYDKMFAKLFELCVDQTNDDKSTLISIWQRCLGVPHKNKGVEVLAIDIDLNKCGLIDDNDRYKSTFPGTFIHAPMQKLYDRLEVKDLDGLISPEMLEPYVRQLFFRSSLIGLAVLATNLVPRHASDQQDLAEYKQKIAVAVVNHPIFDTEIIKSLLAAEAELAAFKGSILDKLFEQAQTLTPGAIYCNRFAAQFFNYLVSESLNYLPSVVQQMLHQARVMNPEISLSFLLARLLKAICSDIQAFYPDASEQVQQLFQALAKSFGMIGLKDNNVLRAYAAYDRTLLTHMDTMLNTADADSQIGGSLAYLNDASVLREIPQEDTKPFMFNQNQETHLLPVSIDEEGYQIYDQFFVLGSNGEIQPLAGNSCFAECNRDDATVTKVWAGMLPEGLVVNCNGTLTSDITKTMTGPIAEVSMTESNGRVKVVITSSNIGFDYSQNTEQEIESLLVVGGKAALLGKSAQAIDAALKQHALSLNLDKLSQVFYYRQASVVVDYLRKKGDIAFGVFIEALRDIADLDYCSRKLQTPRYANLANTCDSVVNHNPYWLDFGLMEKNMLAWKLYGAATASAVVIANWVGSKVTDSYFEGNYSVEIENLVNLVIRVERVANVLGYAALGALWMLSAIKVWHLVKYGRASREQREIDQLISERPGQTPFQHVLTYLNKRNDKGQLNSEVLRLSAEDMATLGEMYSRLQLHHQGIADAAYSQFLRDPNILNLAEQKRLTTPGERKAIMAMTGLRIALTFVPIIAAYSVDKGLRTLHSSDVEDISDKVIQTLVQLAVVLGGAEGLYTILPIVFMLWLLPQDTLVKIGRGFSWLVSCCLPENCSSRQDDQHSVRALQGRVSHFGGKDSLSEPLLTEEERQEAQDTIVEITEEGEEQHQGFTARTSMVA